MFAVIVKFCLVIKYLGKYVPSDKSKPFMKDRQFASMYKRDTRQKQPNVEKKHTKGMFLHVWLKFRHSLQFRKDKLILRRCLPNIAPSA